MMFSQRSNIAIGKGMKAVALLLVTLLLLPLALQAQKREKESVVLETAADSSLTPAQNIIRRIGLENPVPVIQYEPVAPPKYWTTGTLTQLGFSQVSLTNWAAGGSGSIAMNGYVNAMRNYAKGNLYWDNRIQVSYGFVQSFDQGYRKSEDKFILDSKVGYSTFKNFFFSAELNIKSQISPGFTYSSNNEATRVSKFLSPGYITFGIGIDYKPKGKWYSATFAPLTLNTIIVTQRSLRTKYGNKENEAVRVQLGAQLTGNINYTLKNFKAVSKLVLFSDYKNNPENIKVTWDVMLAYKVNRFLEATLRTNLIYDDEILIKDKDGHLAPRVQFKEVLGFSFAYTIGEFKK